MNRLVLNLIAVAERSEHGYADVPPGSINEEIESELAAFGYAICTERSPVDWWIPHPYARVDFVWELQAIRAAVNLHLRVVLACTSPRCPRLRS